MYSLILKSWNIKKTKRNMNVIVEFIIQEGIIGTVLEFKKGKVLCTNSIIFAPKNLNG